MRAAAAKRHVASRAAVPWRHHTPEVTVEMSETHFGGVLCCDGVRSWEASDWIATPRGSSKTRGQFVERSEVLVHSEKAMVAASFRPRGASVSAGGRRCPWARACVRVIPCTQQADRRTEATEVERSA